jgi:hypothetical protein
MFRGRAFCATPRLSRVTNKIVQAAIKLLTGRISFFLVLSFLKKLLKETKSEAKGQIENI